LHRRNLNRNLQRDPAVIMPALMWERAFISILEETVLPLRTTHTAQFSASSS